MLDFGKVREAIASVGEQLASLRAQLEDKKRRHEWLKVAARHPEDVADLAVAAIEINGASWQARLREALEPLRRRPLLELDPKKGLALLCATKPDTTASVITLESALSDVFRDEIARRVRELVLSWDPGEHGPRLAERKAELAKLDAEIEALEAREQELVDQAHAAGIRI